MKSRVLFALVAILVLLVAGCHSEAEKKAPVPLIQDIDIQKEFGVKLSGEIWDRPTVGGEKVGDYQFSPDELLLVYNVLSSLPQELILGLKDITIVYQEAPGAGGLYFVKEKKVVIIGTPDRGGASYTARGAFISALYHEIGHYVDFSLLSSKERADFSQLYNQSQSEKDFASRYGMNYLWEDFSTLFGAYTENTEALRQAAGKSRVLAAKFEFISRLFAGAQYKMEERGTIIREFMGERTVWRYESQTNPAAEKFFP